LARTYRLIARGGGRAFYEGEIARTIEAISAHRRLDDPRGPRRPPERVERAARTTYRGVTVHAIGANTQGIATLQMLNMLETFDMKAPASRRRCPSTSRRRPSASLTRTARAIMATRISRACPPSGWSQGLCRRARR
jgi:gamma-glutamyltranspeptidase